MSEGRKEKRTRLEAQQTADVSTVSETERLGVQDTEMQSMFVNWGVNPAIVSLDKFEKRRALSLFSQTASAEEQCIALFLSVYWLSKRSNYPTLFTPFPEQRSQSSLRQLNVLSLFVSNFFDIQKSFMSVTGAMLGIEFGLRLQRAITSKQPQSLQTWMSNAVGFITGHGMPKYGAYNMKNFDILRYYRYFTQVHVIPALVVRTALPESYRQNLVYQVAGKDKDDEIELVVPDTDKNACRAGELPPVNAYKPPLTFVPEPGKLIDIIVHEVNGSPTMAQPSYTKRTVQVALLRYDTVETLKLRVACALKVPNVLLQSIIQTKESTLEQGRIKVRFEESETWRVTPANQTQLQFVNYDSLVLWMESVLKAKQTSFLDADALEQEIGLNPDTFEVLFVTRFETTFRAVIDGMKQHFSYGSPIDLDYTMLYLLAAERASNNLTLESLVDKLIIYSTLSKDFTEEADDTVERKQLVYGMQNKYPYIMDYPAYIQQQEGHNRTQMYHQMLLKIDANKGPFKVPLRQQSYVIQGTFSLEKIDIYKLFDMIDADVFVPFLFINNKFVKAINNIFVPRSWYEDEDDEEADGQVVAPVEDDDEQTKQDNELSLTIYLLVGKDEPEIRKDTIRNKADYVKIVLKELKQDRSLMYNYEIRIETNDNFDEQVLFKRLNKIIANPIEIRAKRMFGYGLTVVSQFKTSPLILHDFMLNNAIVRNTMMSNETSTIYRKFQILRFRLYLDRNSPNYVMVEMKGKRGKTKTDKAFNNLFNITDMNDVWTLLISNTKSFHIDARYVEVLLNKMLGTLQFMQENTDTSYYNYYCLLTNNINHYTQEFMLPREEEGRGRAKSSTLTSSQIASDLFVMNYTTLCSKEQTPEIVELYNPNIHDGTSKYVLTHEQMKEHVQKFDSKSYMLFPPKGEKQYLVYCPSKKYKVLNLRENCMLSNAKKYPYIPCCNELEQSQQMITYTNLMNTKGAGAFTFLDVKNEVQAEEQKKLKAAEFFKSMKLLQKGFYGLLPPLIERLLSISDTSSTSVLTSNHEFVRYGVPLQFGGRDAPELRVLSALCTATGKLTVTIDRLRQLLRTGIMETALKALSMTQEDAETILSEGRYLDPRLWHAVLRQAFRAEILMFTVSEQDKDGKIVCEYYPRVRVINKKDTLYPQTVLLLTHMGSKITDCPDCPQTELLVKVQREGKALKLVQGIFDTFSPQIERLRKFQQQLYPTRFIELEVDDVYKVQTIDGFGLTRSLIPMGSPEVTYVVDPIVNVHSQTQLHSLYNVQTVDYATAKTLLPNSLNVVYNGNVIGLLDSARTSETVSKFIKLTKAVPYTPAMGDVYNTEIYEYPVNPSLDRFNLTKRYYLFMRIANYIRSYVLWKFSKDLDALPSEARRATQTMSQVLDFVRNWLRNNVVAHRIDPQENKYVYRSKDIEMRELSLNNPVIFNSQGKIIIRGNDSRDVSNIVQRLKYAIIHELTFNYTSLVNFKDLYFVPNYYNNSAEFRKTNEFTVYNNMEEYAMAATSFKTKYKVVTSLKFTAESFFVQLTFQNERKTMLAVPSRNLLYALRVAASFKAVKSVFVRNQFPSSDVRIVLYQEDKLNQIEFDGDMEDFLMSYMTEEEINEVQVEQTEVVEMGRDVIYLGQKKGFLNEQPVQVYYTFLHVA